MKFVNAFATAIKNNKHANYVINMKKDKSHENNNFDNLDCENIKEELSKINSINVFVQSEIDHNDDIFFEKLNSTIINTTELKC